jgi:hypothetical protein
VKESGVRKGCKKGLQEREEYRRRSARKGEETTGMCRKYEEKRMLAGE